MTMRLSIMLHFERLTLRWRRGMAPRKWINAVATKHSGETLSPLRFPEIFSQCSVATIFEDC